MRVRCYIGKSVHLSFVGCTLAGLFDQPGCKTSLQIVDWVEDKHCIAVDVDGARLVIEIFDQSDIWDLRLLEWCDVYAKRNIDPNITTPLPSGYRPELSDLYRHLVTPRWKNFEHGPDLPVTDTILYQTRVWEPF